MQSIEMEGASVAEAVDSALKQLGLRRDQAEVVILQQPSQGFMGLGKKLARVRVGEKRWAHGAEEAATAAARPTAPEVKPAPRNSRASRTAVQEKPAPAQVKPASFDTAKAAATAQDVTREVLGLMGFQDAVLNNTWEQEQERILVSIDHPEVGRLIGKEGRTLEALQFLLSIALKKRLGFDAALSVDAGDYWKKRETELLAEVDSAIEEVKRTGRAHRFQPMDPIVRRLIHKHVATHPDVSSASEGEGQWRKVVIKPKR